MIDNHLIQYVFIMKMMLGISDNGTGQPQRPGHTLVHMLEGPPPKYPEESQQNDPRE